MDLEEEERPRPNRCTKIVYFAWKIFTCLFTHVMLVTAVVAYCIAGAYAFSMLEKDHELAVKRNISLIRGNVTQQLWTLTKESDVLYEEKWRDQVVMKLKEFEGELVASMKLGGWDGKEGEKNTQWTFHGALFYSIIVITTIGYGHIAPKTEYGKVTTIMYAIVGIPLMLLCLSNIGDIMANSFRFLYWRICCYACTQPPKRSHSHGHSQHRRGRSVRSTARSHGAGGRASGRSRTSSLRRPHGSQRSADSALALSDITHSYSDTECRYYDEGDDAPKVRGSNKRQPGQHRNSDPQNSAPKDSEDVKNETPVLFNKYALDREESCRVNNKMPPRIVTRSPVPSRKARAQTAEPCSRPDMYLAPPLRSSSLRQTYPGRREVGSERGYRHRTGSYDYNYEYNRDNYKESNTVIKPVPIWLCMFLVISYIIGGAFLFHGWEGWSFADSAYFCFITLTTIGFGDFVPAQKMSDDAQVSIALCSLYLLFGIALLAMSFNLVQEEVISNVKSVARNLGILKDESDDDYY